ncbi:sugar phosphate nucleotidyltransferase [Bernardetia sp. ABR2-2B]|uniref:sugar phosphate nucleotidyltransferase n=1 Tax=Bernardetia sp. ABR2-2B TaxID=3127472 RepID=UPI0030CA92AA
MKIIIPMAGRGSRLRPHTLTVPKPLVPVVGKPIVERLVEDLARSSKEKIEEIAFIIGDFGEEAEKELLKVAENAGSKGKIYHQDAPLGTAHAIMCAKESLSGNIIVAFADTLFKADFSINTENDGVIWVQKVADPSAYGVVQLDEHEVINNFVEKPKDFVSDLAIIGIYYFRDGEYLRSELQYVIDNNIKDKGEYQLTTALENMRQKGTKFRTGQVEEWLDCGNKDAVVFTNQRYLEYLTDRKTETLVSPSANIENSVIIEPVFLAEGVHLKNSVVGPHVSIGKNTHIHNSRVQNSVIQSDTLVENALLENTMLGNFVKYNGKSENVSLGDYSEVKK